MREEKSIVNIVLFIAAAFCIALLLFGILSHHEKVVHEDVIARTEWSGSRYAGRR